MLTVIDEHSRKFRANDAPYRLSELFFEHGLLDHSARTTARNLRPRLCGNGGKVPVSPRSSSSSASSWESGYNESFNGKLRDELLNGEVFMTLDEAKCLIEQWRVEYDAVRPHRPQATGRRHPR